MSSNHALIIGGTGTLSDVSLWLVYQGYVVSAIMRWSNFLIIVKRHTKKRKAV
ncbi:hypothetical protein [Halobacillus campisalis]|uniref:Uncharacterized protein n=1 Tax=Halobacillus campisalis TaxID=435909 RepID=A0ABW2K5R7_9BACI|nr:hypothetical protein [Halobacillus campisalis]